MIWLCLICVCISNILSMPCSLIINNFSKTYIQGVLLCQGNDAKDVNIHDTSVTFYMSQSNNVANLSIEDRGGRNVISFGAEYGKITQIFVFGKEVDEKEQKESMIKLQESQEYRILPVLSSLLGTKYNVSATQWPISMLLYRLALASESWHKTEEHAIKTLRQKHMKLQKRNTADSSSKIIDGLESMMDYITSEVDPWTYDPENEVLCPSPDGVCDERIVEHSKCVGRGVPLQSIDIKEGCMGLCGPHCYRCWSYICGDCCKHPGCYSHDSKCSDGYLSLECITGKGLIWGDNTDIC